MMKKELELFKPYTMTSFPRMDKFAEFIEQVEREEIPGAIVECGVWKGGNIMLACHLLNQLQSNRKVWAYDTFTGMTPPGEYDVDWNGVKGTSRYQKGWCKITVTEVKDNVAPLDAAKRVKYVRGDVMKTIPEKVPSKIAVTKYHLLVS